MFSLPPQASSGTDWVAVARWLTVGYGVLTVIGALAVGLLVRHITVPVTDPNTGHIVNQTFDIGALMVFAAAIVAVLFAFFAWLMQFALARIIMLVLTLLAALSALARLSGGPMSLLAASLGSLLLDAGLGFVLVMSIVSRPRPEY